MDQKDLTEILAVSASTVTRILDGSSLTMTLITFDRLRRLEALFDIPAGLLVRQLASTGERGATEEAIRGDASLPDDVKDAMVAILDHFAGTDASVTDLGTRRTPAESEKLAAAATGDTSVSKKQKEQLDKRVADRKGTDEPPKSPKRKAAPKDKRKPPKRKGKGDPTT